MQSFPELRERGFVYVDKTRYIRKLMDDGKYYFLGRPRRFGKSLFISTMRAYFEGRRELFDGLAIADMENEWAAWPVLHIDFTGQDYTVPDSLEHVIGHMLEDWEKEFGITEIAETDNLRFQNIISTAHRLTGKKVIILVDEYDKPLIDTIDYPELQERYRNQLRGIYGNLKKMDPHIRLAFLTGITRFGKLNIFSDINNLRDISLLSEFSGICGVTSEELRKYFHAGIAEFANWRKCTVEEMYEILRVNYDGYHFSPEGSPDIYNPFSLLNALSNKQIGEYWFSTGTPLFLVKRIRSQVLDLEDFNCVEVDFSDIENVPFNMEGDPVPILYQSGYLTIKRYDAETRLIILGYPNREVERGFLRQLMDIYTSPRAIKSAFNILKFKSELQKGDVDGFMERLQAFFASIEYDSFDLLKLEQHYRNVIYLLFKLLGYYCHAEYKTANGRIDLVIENDSYVYVFEFKINKTAREALDQIDSKDYLLPYRFDGRKLIKIGANFTDARKNIDSWLTE